MLLQVFQKATELCDRAALWDDLLACCLANLWLRLAGCALKLNFFLDLHWNSGCIV